MKITQEEAARILDVTLRGYANWESGKTPVARRVDLAVQMLLRQHRTRVGNGGFPLLYVVRTYENEKGGRPLEYYLVIARNEHEAVSLTHQKLGSPSELVVVSEAIADAPKGTTLRVLGTIADIASTKELSTFDEWSSEGDSRGYSSL